ncbi:hypothetical protein KI387_017104, partial [Taxus chinensis]
IFVRKKNICEGGDVIDADQSEEKDRDVKNTHGGCGAYVPKISVEGLKVMIHYKLPKKADEQAQEQFSDKKQELTTDRVLTILKGITDEQCEMLGFNPKYARPDWMILEVLPVPPPPVRPSIKPDPTSRSEATQKSGRPMKSISSRLKAKEGRIRGNLMGKRVDFSARTVITADPNLNIDELGVPWSIALNMTFPEIVTPYNIDRLKELVEYGSYPPPGKA